MKIKISILFLIFFLISNSYSKDDKLNFRGGKIGSENKRELRKPETAVKIDEDFLKYNPLASIKELDRSEQYMTTLTKNIKLNENLEFRGSGKNIYSEYSNSIFLIVSRDKNDSKKGGTGTGSLISRDGYIVTNFHVIENNLNGDIEIYTKPKSPDRKVGDKYIAKVELVNPSSDLAILKLNNLPKSITPIPIGSYQDIKIGDEVHAIGHPNNLYWSYTKGVVSQIRQNYSWKFSSNQQRSATLIQTQTPISPGNSGGPLFSPQGKIIGVNTMKAEGENLNFAVAIDEANKIIRNKDNYINKNKSNEIVPKSKIVSKKFPDAVGETDYNKNGVIDTWYFDTNKNGIVDKAFIDDDENGVIEAALFDNDEDGNWDSMVIDTNGDGKGDKVVVFNKSGKATHVGYDYNQDGKVDKWEKV
jgi:S1-C subfamily serine protease